MNCRLVNVLEFVAVDAVNAYADGLDRNRWRHSLRESDRQQIVLNVLDRLPPIYRLLDAAACPQLWMLRPQQQAVLAQAIGREVEEYLALGDGLGSANLSGSLASDRLGSDRHVRVRSVCARPC